MTVNTRHCAIASTLVALLACVPGVALAQDTPARRQQTIEIRGQVPTPQVVTVRPREAPGYDRRILVPAFFDRDFWPTILPAIQILPTRSPTTSPSAADTVAPRLTPATPPRDSTRVPPTAAPSRAAPTATPRPGTPPAPPDKR